MSKLIPNYQSLKMDAPGKNGRYPVSNLIEVIRVETSSHKEDVGYLLTLRETYANGRTRDFQATYQSLVVSQERTAGVLARNGYSLEFPYTNHFRRYITDEFSKYMNSGKVDYSHSALGFTKMSDDSRLFLLQESKYKNSITVYDEPTFDFKRGNRNDYIKLLEEHVLPYDEMKLALTLGLTSVVASDLKELEDLDTLVINIFGGSSTGKTTATQFIASLWGNPRISNRGIVRTFNATQNSLIHTLEGINGVPIIIDDATSMGNQDLTQFIYSMAAGETKLRLTQDIELRDNKGNWSGLVGITAESSMLEHSTVTSGIIPRLIEFGNVAWTNSGEHAKAIKRTIYKTYGHIGEEFVNKYLKCSTTEKQDMLEGCIDELDEGIKSKDPYSSRIVAKLGVIYMTAKLIEEMFEFTEYKSESIRDYLIEFEESHVNMRSLENKAIEIIKDFIIRKQANFYLKVKGEGIAEIVRTGEFIGYREFQDSEVVHVTIMSSLIKSELARNGIFQWSETLRLLESKDFVKKYGKNKKKASEKDNYLNVKAITFIFKREENDELMRWYSPVIEDPVRELKKSDISLDDDNQIDDIFK